MSVSKVQEILSSALPTQSGPRQSGETTLYFAYGTYLSFLEFQKKYPGAKTLGIGFLDNWTWHINSLGEPNVRPSPITHTGVIVKGPTAFPMLGTGTFEWQNAGSFGSIFVISPEIEDSIDREHGASRVKICQSINVVISRPKVAPVIRKLDCILHYDPWNTSDGCRDVWEDSYAEQSSWLTSLAGLRQSGVPDWYISRIFKHLQGRNGDAEPFSMETVELQPRYSPRGSCANHNSYRIQKHHSNLSSKRMGSDHAASNTRPKSNSVPCVRSGQKQESTTHPRRRVPSASASRPIRRQEAILVRNPTYTRYPQIRSTSAAVPGRFQQVQLPGSSDSPGAHNGGFDSAFPSEMYAQVPNSPGNISSGSSESSDTSSESSESSGSEESSGSPELSESPESPESPESTQICAKPMMQQ